MKMQGAFSDELLKDELDQMFPYLDKTPGRKQFCHLLRSPVYYGDFKYNGTVYKGDPQLHPPLVSKDVWLNVQDILEGRHKKRRLSKAHPYIGLMVCRGKIMDQGGNLSEESCGCAITAERIRKHYKNGTTQEFDYYRCSNTERPCSQRDKTYMREVVGRKVSYRDHEIEEIFQSIFQSFSFDEVTYQRMKQYLWKEHFEQKKNDHSKKSELRQRQQKLDHFIEESYEDKLQGKRNGTL